MSASDVRQNESLIAMADNARMISALGMPPSDFFINENDDMIAALDVRSPNRAAAADAVLRAGQLQSFANWLQMSADRRLAEMEDALVKEIRDRNPTVANGVAHPNMLASLFSVSDSVIKGAFSDMLYDASSNLADAGYILTKSAAQKISSTVSVRAPAVAELPVLGLTLLEHFRKMADDAILRFKAAVRQGVAAGDDIDKLVARVTGEGADPAANAFCPTGQGGGVDPTCGSGTASKIEALVGDDSQKPFCYGDCRVETYAVTKRALEKGIKDFKIVHGGVMDGDEEVDHTWIETMDGKIVDPTRSQFKSKNPIYNPKNSGYVRTIERPAEFISGIEEGENVARDYKFRKMKNVANADPSLAEVARADAAKKRLLTAIRLVDSSTNSIAKVIQAAVTALSNDADFQAMLAAPPEASATVNGFQWQAMQDDRVCEQCSFYDGQRWDADFKPLDDGPEYPGDAPLHFGCRCATVPTNVDEAPAEPEDMQSYLRKFTRAEQEQAFGAGPLAAFRRGEIEAGQLIGQKTNLLTLEQLRKARLGQ